MFLTPFDLVCHLYINKYVNYTTDMDTTTRDMEELKVLIRAESDLLDIIEHKDEFAHSDLQGAIGAVVLSVYRQGKGGNHAVSNNE